VSVTAAGFGVVWVWLAYFLVFWWTRLDVVTSGQADTKASLNELGEIVQHGARRQRFEETRSLGVVFLNLQGRFAGIEPHR
jgi:hypothetical protein